MDRVLLVIIALQIVVEALPISSSGHLQLVSMLFAQTLPSLPDHFDHFLHGPSLILVILFFWREWTGLVRAALMILKKMMHGTEWQKLPSSNRRFVKMVGFVALSMCIADGVTAVLYVVIKVLCKHLLVLQSPGALLVGFCVTGVVLFWGGSMQKTLPAHGACPTKLHERGRKCFLRQQKMYHTIILGFVQGLALLPGISRFATTVVAAQFLGFSPRRAMQCSFLMFFPLMLAAFVFNGLPAVVGTLGGPVLLTLPVIVTLLSATLLSFPAFVLSYRLVETRNLWKFGIYMLVPIVATMWLVATNFLQVF